MEPSLCAQAAAPLLAADPLFAPLVHAFSFVFTFGCWCVIGAVIYRLLCPYLKGGR
jgi:hypothetical protein